MIPVSETDRETITAFLIFMPPPEALCFHVCACVRPCVCLFSRDLWCELTDFLQTFVASASCDKAELIRFWCRVKRSKIKLPAIHHKDTVITFAAA